MPVDELRSKSCRRCGFENLRSAQACENCGNDITAGPTSPSADQRSGTDDYVGVLDEALAIVADYGDLLQRAGVRRRLVDLPHSPERIKKAILILYSSLPVPAIQHLIRSAYPRKQADSILSDQFWAGLHAGMNALPEFLPDEDAELRAAFLRKASLSDAQLERVLGIEQRVLAQAKAYLDEAERWRHQGK